MVLTPDDRRRMAAAFAVFVRVDERRKAVKKSNRKSKPTDEKKARSPTGLRAFLFLQYWNYHIIIFSFSEKLQLPHQGLFRLQYPLLIYLAHFFSKDLHLFQYKA